MIFEIAMIILVVYYFSKDPSHVKDWERHFIEQYETKGNETVKLKFDASNTALLIKLCKKKVKKKEMLSYPPCKETNFIDFKKHKHPPFHAEMIRCKKKFAIIDAPGHHCAYVLTKGKHNKHVNGDTFYISEKFCYHPPKSLHMERKHQNMAEEINTFAEYEPPEIDTDHYPHQYKEREYRENRSLPFELNHLQYALKGYPPYYSYPQDKKIESNYYHQTDNPYGKFYNHQVNPKTESNPLPQFEDQRQLYENYGNTRGSQYVRNYEPPHKFEDYPPMHRPTFTENYSNNENLQYSIHHSQSLPPENKHWVKLDEPSRNIGRMVTAPSNSNHLTATRLPHAENSYMKNQPSLKYFFNNNQPSLQFKDKLPQHSSSNPEYKTHNDDHRQRSSLPFTLDEYGRMNSHSESLPYRTVNSDGTVRQINLNNNQEHHLSIPSHGQSPTQDNFRYETESYYRNAYKPVYKNEYEYSDREGYKQRPLHLDNEVYSTFEHQPLENYRLDKPQKDGGLNEDHSSYKPRVTSELEIFEKIQPIHNTYNSETINREPLHKNKSLLEGSKPKVETAAYNMCNNEEPILRQYSPNENQQSFMNEEQLSNKSYNLFNENAEFYSETRSCKECGNTSPNPFNEHALITEIPNSHPDNHIPENNYSSSVLKQNGAIMGHSSNEENHFLQDHQFLEHQSPTGKTTLNDNNSYITGKEIDPLIPMQEKMSTCDECGSKQSYPLNIHSEIKSLSSLAMNDEKYSNSTHQPKNKNQALKSIKKNELNYKQQLPQKNYRQSKKYEEYPIYGGSRNHQESNLDNELEKLYYHGKIFIQDEEPYSSPKHLKKLPSSYLVSSNSTQTKERPAMQILNKNFEENELQDNKLFENHFNRTKRIKPSYSEKHISLPRKPIKEYPSNKLESFTNIDNLSEVELNLKKRQQRIYKGSHMKPYPQARKIHNQTIRKANFLSNSRHLGEEEEETLISSQDESLLQTISGDDYSSDGKETRSLKKSQHNLLNNTLKYQTLLQETSNQSEQSDYLSQIEEIEQEINRQKLGQLYNNNNQSYRKKQERQHNRSFVEDLPKKSNITKKHKKLSLPENRNYNRNERTARLSKTRNKNIGEENVSDLDDAEVKLLSITSEHSSSLESQNYDSEYSLPKKNKVRNQFDQNKEKYIQSSSQDSPSSSENQDNDMRTSGYLLTKSDKKETKSPAHQNKEEGVQLSESDRLSSSESRDSNSKKTSNENLETEHGRQLSQNEEEKTQLNASNNSSSPENQVVHDERVTRSVYPLTGNINQSGQNKKKSILLDTSKRPSSSERRVDDIKIRSGYFLTRNEELKTKSPQEQIREEEVQLSGLHNLNLSESQGRDLRLRYFSNEEETPKFQRRLNQNENGSVQSSTQDYTSSPESRDNGMKTIRLQRSLTKNTEVRVTSQSDQNEEEMDHRSLLKSQNDMENVRPSSLLTKNTQAVTRSQLDLKKEARVQSSTQNNESSPESQENDIRSIGPEYLLTKNK